MACFLWLPLLESMFIRGSRPKRVYINKHKVSNEVQLDSSHSVCPCKLLVHNLLEVDTSNVPESTNEVQIPLFKIQAEADSTITQLNLGSWTTQHWKHFLSGYS
jgi:hypothetical protein